MNTKIKGYKEEISELRRQKLEREYIELVGNLNEQTRIWKYKRKVNKYR